MAKFQALKAGLATWVMAAAIGAAAAAPLPIRQVERLDRGVVAVPAKGGGVLVSWRSLASDARDAAFEVYRDGHRITPRPVTDSTNFRDAAGTPASRYAVRMIASGTAGARTAAVPVWPNGYLSIPLDPPPGGVTPAGSGTPIPPTTWGWAISTGTGGPTWC
ncbi:rhamnogalacturonan endolyase family protein [Sphingomonas panni]